MIVYPIKIIVSSVITEIVGNLVSSVMGILSTAIVVSWFGFRSFLYSYWNITNNLLSSETSSTSPINSFLNGLENPSLTSSTNSSIFYFAATPPAPPLCVCMGGGGVWGVSNSIRVHGELAVFPSELFLERFEHQVLKKKTRLIAEIPFFWIFTI